MATPQRGHIGARIRRKEDRRLLMGAGRYVDDVPLDNPLHVAFVRSPYAHAHIRGVGLAAARALPGVVDARAGAAARERLGALPSEGWKLPGPTLRAVADPLVRTETQHLLAVERARYVGEPVAFVVAADRYAAEDAAERVVVDYEPLAAVTDATSAAAAGAPLLHPELGDNLSARVRIGTGDVEAAFARADRVVRRRLKVQRIAGIPMETRGVAAWIAAYGRLNVWSATQTPHSLRKMLAHLLGLDEARVHVVAPDVGGGFGIKALIYPEEILVGWMALEHGRAVKWTEDRHEHFLSAIQSRDQQHDVELALRADGTILGLRDRFTVDMGAYNPLGLVQPYNTAAHLVGCYRVPAIDIEATCYFTNKAPLAPYRGAGRPEAVFAMDRIVDCAAHELAIDPAALRRRNLVTSAEMPYDVGMYYRDGHKLEYDSGDYPACLEQALALIDYDAVRREQPALWARGIYRGIGLSTYVEGTGVGPFEGGVVRLDESGHVWVHTGASSQGQGHETTFAQVAAEQLDVDVEQVTIVGGDTAGIDRGWGTLASRSAVVAGTAIALASQDVGTRLRELAAELLEAAPDDLELHQGAVRVKGTPGRAAPFARLVALATSKAGGQAPSAAIGGGTRRPGAGEPVADRQTGPASLTEDPSTGERSGAAEGQSGERRSGPPDGAPAGDSSGPPGGLAGPPAPEDWWGAAGAHAPEHLASSLEATRYFEPPTVTYANAVHAALVEVDVETGLVRVLKYVVVHDCGRAINPLVIDGQICGGVAQGLGDGLMEELVYDENGQLLTASLLDYLVPTAGEIPPFGLGHHESPSPRNPLGLKGLGEGGAISPPAALANAVDDALRPFGVEVHTMPLAPARVLALIEAARGRVEGPPARAGA
jgi:aerobic carbon-monoxide dehydrogenase large subunit